MKEAGEGELTGTKALLEGKPQNLHGTPSWDGEAADWMVCPTAEGCWTWLAGFEKVPRLIFLSAFSSPVGTRGGVALTITSAGAWAEVPESVLMSVVLLHRTQTHPTGENRPAAINHPQTGIYWETACVTSEMEQLSHTPTARAVHTDL